MIDLYSWPVPDGQKVHIMLEECRLPYAVHPVDLRAGDRLRSAFLAISAAGRVPAIVDSDGPGGKPIRLSEPGAILVYLAAKTGRLMPRSERGRYEMLQWLMWQAGGFGPMQGQDQPRHFRPDAPRRIGQAREHDAREHDAGGPCRPHAVSHGRPPAAPETDGASPHPCEVLDIRLGRTGAYVAGAHYGIADIAIWPWVRSQASRGMDLAGHPNLERWFESVGARPAVQRGIALLADRLEPPAGGQARENPSGTARPAQRRGGTRLQA